MWLGVTTIVPGTSLDFARCFLLTRLFSSSQSGQLNDRGNLGSSKHLIIQNNHIKPHFEFQNQSTNLKHTKNITSLFVGSQ